MEKGELIMPYPYAHKLLVWPHSCEKVSFASRMKLEAAKRAGYDKAITFEFSHFLSPQSAYLQAGHLYDRYREYFEIK